MPMCRWLAALSFALLTPLVPAQQSPVIRVDVKLVHILATVKNPDGQLIGTLAKNDFEIYDNGAAQEVSVFERQTAMPLNVAVMVDTSGSTAKELRYEVESVNRFFKAFFAEGNRNDLVALYSFNWQVTREQYFTRSHASLERVVRQLKGEAGTCLYDAIYLAARDLEQRDGRKAMVIVTDGGDTTSKKNVHAALEAAQLADAVIYPIVVMPITNDAGRNIGGENALTFMAQGTGGRTFMPSVGPGLDKALSDILTDLRTQYLLAYYPRNVPLTKNRFHKLEVRVRRPELRVLARNGYYGDAEGDSATPGARISVIPESKKFKRQEN